MAITLDSWQAFVEASGLPDPKLVHNNMGHNYMVHNYVGHN